MLLDGLPFPEWLQLADRFAPTRVAVPKAVATRATHNGYILWGPGRQARSPLKWGEYAFACDFAEGGSTKGCLNRFLALDNTSDDRVADFARQWGVLGFCKEHGLPGAHGNCAPAFAFEDSPYLWYLDRTEDWRALARQFRATLWLAHSALNEGGARPQRLEDFQAALGTTPEAAMVLWEATSPTERVELVVSRLLEKANFRPVVRWDQRRKKFLIIPGSGLFWAGSHDWGDAASSSLLWPENSLYQVLLARLATAVATGEFVQCGRCGVSFDWEDAGYERIPRYDRAAYCTDWCRMEARREQKAGWKRLRNRRFREERKEKP